MSYGESTNAQPGRAPSPHLTSSQPLSDVMYDLQHFFIDDNGNLLVLLPDHDAPIQLNRRALHRVTRRASVSSFSTTSSLSSVSTAVPTRGIVELSLADVCDHIDDHPSLRAAQIISTECYAVKAGAVTHRFIVLELRRRGRKDVWLRLDRRREDKVSLLQFFAASGITRANDRAMLSADKNALVGDAFHENTQVFEVPPILSEFTRLLRIIQEEIILYRIWPENCWFFCSLIQQHLEGAQTGWFAIGSLKYANLARDIRVRISLRVLSGRPPTHRPRASDIHTSTPPARTPSLSLSLPPPLHFGPSPFLPSTSLPTVSLPSPSINTAIRVESPSAEVIEALEQLTQNESLEEKVRNDAVEALKLASDMDKIDGNTMADQKAICEQLSLLLNSLPFDLPGLETLRAILQGEAVRLQRGVTGTETPLGEQATLGLMLIRLGAALERDGRPAEACPPEEEAILIHRETYRIWPSASRPNIALSLYNYGINLRLCKRYKEACATSAEAVELYRIMFERDPDKHRKDFADSLQNCGLALSHMHLFENARKNYEEAAALYRQPYKMNPEKHRENLALYLGSYSDVLDDLGLVGEQHVVLEEIRALHQEMESLS